MGGRKMDAKTIFSKALELQIAQERAAYLDEACGDNASLRADAEDLLSALDGAGRFMAGPAGGPAETIDAPRISEEPGMVIDRYKLLEQIGEGGTGLVYVAEKHRSLGVL